MSLQLTDLALNIYVCTNKALSPTCYLVKLLFDILLIYLLLNALYTTILWCLSSKHARSEKSDSSLKTCAHARSLFECWLSRSPMRMPFIVAREARQQQKHTCWKWKRQAQQKSTKHTHTPVWNWTGFGTEDSRQLLRLGDAERKHEWASMLFIDF